MFLRILILLMMLTGGACGALAVEWTNLTPENRLGGRMVSSGYLRGKVVLLDCRDYGVKESFEAIRGLQQTWTAYKSKPFVIVGGHRGEQSAKRMGKILERLEVTYPVYAQADVADAPEKEKSAAIRVYDSTGTVCLYKGNDWRQASGAVGSAIFATIKPATAKQWKRLLDYEITNLPGQAYLRLKSLEKDAEASAELRREYPDDLRRYGEAYAAFKQNKEVKKLAKLVDLARKVKDLDRTSEEAQKISKAAITRVIGQYEPLKESVDSFIVQEAKNAIADLMFAQATLPR